MQDIKFKCSNYYFCNIFYLVAVEIKTFIVTCFYYMFPNSLLYIKQYNVTITSLNWDLAT